MCDTTLRKDLRYSSLDNFFFSVMVGAGETFLPAFALAMGTSQVTAGLLAAFPFLLGSLVQLAAPRAIARVGSYRRWLVGLGFIQAFSFLPLVIFALLGRGISDWVLYLVVTAYWAAGLGSGPAWSSWMTSLVPNVVRTKYFAKRNYLGQVGLLVGLMGGGLLLQVAKSEGWELRAFAALFLVSGLVRMVAALCLGRQSEVPEVVREQKRVSIWDVVTRLRSGADGRVIAFLLIFGVAVNSASPFFNPYMLKQLNLSYLPYMILIAASFVSKIFVFRWLGTVARHMSPLRLLQMGVFGATFSPLFWLFSNNYLYLVGAQVLSGAVWAIYDLGVTLALFSVVRDDERTSFLSVYNFASALMVFGGTTFGAKVLAIFGENTKTYFLLFGLSCAARLLAYVFLDRTVEQIEGVREAERKASGLRPLMALVSSQTASVSNRWRPLRSRVGKRVRRFRDF